jgi:hypothetical protein
MPFLGLNAWSDVTLCAGVVGILITGAIRTETGARTGARSAIASAISAAEPKALLEPSTPEAPDPQSAGHPS